jgi:hypothetical protein
MITPSHEAADTAGRRNTRVGGRPLVPRRSGMVSRPRLVADSIDVVIRRSGNLNGPGRLKPVHSCRFALIPANVVDARQ